MILIITPEAVPVVPTAARTSVVAVSSISSTVVLVVPSISMPVVATTGVAAVTTITDYRVLVIPSTIKTTKVPPTMPITMVTRAETATKSLQLAALERKVSIRIQHLK